jgi:hypothetical protein
MRVETRWQTDGRWISQRPSRWRWRCLCRSDLAWAGLGWRREGRKFVTRRKCCFGAGGRVPGACDPTGPRLGPLRLKRGSSRRASSSFVGVGGASLDGLRHGTQAVLSRVFLAPVPVLVALLFLGRPRDPGRISRGRGGRGGGRREQGFGHGSGTDSLALALVRPCARRGWGTSRGEDLEVEGAMGIWEGTKLEVSR